MANFVQVVVDEWSAGEKARRRVLTLDADAGDAILLDDGRTVTGRVMLLGPGASAPVLPRTSDTAALTAGRFVRNVAHQEDGDAG